MSLGVPVLEFLILVVVPCWRKASLHRGLPQKVRLQLNLSVLSSTEFNSKNWVITGVGTFLLKVQLLSKPPNTVC